MVDVFTSEQQIFIISSESCAIKNIHNYLFAFFFRFVSFLLQTFFFISFYFISNLILIVWSSF